MILVVFYNLYDSMIIDEQQQQGYQFLKTLLLPRASKMCQKTPKNITLCMFLNQLRSLGWSPYLLRGPCQFNI